MRAVLLNGSAPQESGRGRRTAPPSGAFVCPQGSAAAGCSLKGPADLGHLVGAQLRYRLNQERLWHGPQVVEADRALAGHAIAGVELNLGLYARIVRVTKATTTLRSFGIASLRVST